MNEDDAKEVDAFYDAEQGKLFSYIRKMGLGVEDAEDVLNDAFLAICTRWRKIRDGSPRGYLYEAARNEIKKRWRSSSRRPGEAWDPSAVATGEFAQQVADRQSVRGALDTLTDREREAVLLHHYAGFDITEIALIMGGITPGAV